MTTDNYYKKKNQMFNTPGIMVLRVSIIYYLFLFSIPTKYIPSIVYSGADSSMT